MGRRPIPKDKKKLPSEYPQFTFRVSKAKKKEINRLTETIQKARNGNRKEGWTSLEKVDT